MADPEHNPGAEQHGAQEGHEAPAVNQVKQARERVKKALFFNKPEKDYSFDNLFSDIALVQENDEREAYEAKQKENGRWGFLRKSLRSLGDTEYFNNRIKFIGGENSQIHDEFWKYLDKAIKDNNKEDIGKGLRAFRALGYDKVFESFASFGKADRSYDRFFDDLAFLDSRKLLEKPPQKPEPDPNAPKKEKTEDEKKQEALEKVSDELRKHYESLGADPQIRSELLSRIKENDYLDNSKKVLDYLNVADKLGYTSDPKMKNLFDRLENHHGEIVRQQQETKEKQEKEEAERKANEEAEKRQQEREEAQRKADEAAAKRAKQREEEKQRQEREEQERQQREKEEADRKAREEADAEAKRKEEADKAAAGTGKTAGANDISGGSTDETSGSEQPEQEHQTPPAPEPAVEPDQPEASPDELEKMKAEVQEYLSTRWEEMEPVSGLDQKTTIKRFTAGLTLLNEWIVSKSNTVNTETMKIVIPFLINNMWPANIYTDMRSVRLYLRLFKDNEEVTAELARAIYKGIDDLDPYNSLRPRGEADKKLAKAISERLALFSVDQIDKSEERLLEITQRMVEIFKKANELVDKAGYFK